MNGLVHKPCAFNPNGASKERCIEISSIPMRATRCLESKCQSPWRATTGIMVKADPLDSITTKIVTADAARQTRPVMIKKAEPPPIEVDEKWQKLLARAREAMSQAITVSVSPQTIRPMPGQPRSYFSESSMLSLRNSISTVGQIQPGIIRSIPKTPEGHTYELLDGERRWRAVMAENIEIYRAQLVEIEDEAVPFMIAAIANFNRADHTPLEIADAIGLLHNGSAKVPIEAVAKMFGFSVMWTYQMYGLRNLHQEVRHMLDPELPKDKLLPVTAAVQISKMDVTLQVEIARRVLKKELNITRLRSAIVELSNKSGKPIRTRLIEPRKLIDSFERRCLETSRLSEVLLSQLNEMRARNILPSRTANRTRSIVVSLEAAARDLNLIKDLLS